MVAHPFLYNVWSHVNDPIPEPFKDIIIENLVTSIMDMLKTIPVEDFQHYYQKWECLYRCVAAQENYFEGGKIDV